MQPRYLRDDDERVVAWTDGLAIQLQANVQRSSALLAMSAVHMTTGDLVSAERYLERADAAGANHHNVNANRARTYQNLCQFSKAVAAAKDVPWVASHNAETGLGILVGSGGFVSAAGLLRQADLATMTPQFLDLDDLNRIADWAEQAKVPEADTCQVLDVAGELMRAQDLFWLDSTPTVLFDDEMQCPGIRFFVEVSPSEATAMNIEFTDRIVKLGLDSVPMTVGFIGTVDEAGLAEG